MKKEERDDEDYLREIRDLTYKNNTMLRSMRRMSLIKTVIYSTILIFSLYYGYSFYQTVQSSFSQLREGVVSLEGGSDEVVRTLVSIFFNDAR